jgi:hypothetical protein
MTFPNGGIRKEKVSSKMNKMDTTGYDSEGENKSEWGAGNFFRTFKGLRQEILYSPYSSTWWQIL